MLAIISLTNSCNYSCGYCVATSQCGGYKTNKAKQCSKSGHTEIRGCVLDMDRLLNYLNEFVPEGSTVVLTGGEPMSVPYFTSFVVFLAQRYRIVIETNGSQLFKTPTDMMRMSRHGVEFHIAWHPKMILLEKFISSMREFKERCQGVAMKLVNLAGINDEMKGLHDEFEIIVNNGNRPDVGVKFWQDMMFIRPNGKVMECPGASAAQIGDVYEGSLNVTALKNYYHKCSLRGHLFCNTILHASGLKPTLRIE